MGALILRFLGHVASAVVGRLARVQLPAPFGTLLIRSYAFLYGVKLAEIERPIGEYKTLAEFFVRHLKEGSRTMPRSAERLIVSPVDGRLRSCGRIEDTMVRHVKGQDFSLQEFLEDAGKAERFSGGYMWNLYLSPGDYHQIHSPVSGSIIESRLIPGTLFPVNALGFRLIPKLLARNERLVTYIETERGMVAVVKVGALNVGTITTSYDTWNLPGSMPPSSGARLYSEPISILVGEHLGTFHLGSSVVLLVDKNMLSQLEVLPVLPETRVTLFEPLGAFGGYPAHTNNH